MKHFLFTILLLSNAIAEAATCNTPYGTCYVPNSGLCTCSTNDGSIVYGYTLPDTPGTSHEEKDPFEQIGEGVGGLLLAGLGLWFLNKLRKKHIIK